MFPREGEGQRTGQDAHRGAVGRHVGHPEPDAEQIAPWRGVEVGGRDLKVDVAAVAPDLLGRLRVRLLGRPARALVRPELDDVHVLGAQDLRARRAPFSQRAMQEGKGNDGRHLLRDVLEEGVAHELDEPLIGGESRLALQRLGALRA